MYTQSPKIGDSVKSQSTFLPEIKINANNDQLNHLKKRMLANYYQKQIKQKNQDQILSRRLSSLNTPYTIQSNPESSRVSPNRINFFQANQIQKDKQRIFKLQLAQEYQRQMQRKQQQKKVQKEMKKRQDAVMVQTLKKMSQAENQKYKNLYQLSKNTMNQHIIIASKNKSEKILNKRKDQQAFNQRYAKKSQQLNAQSPNNNRNGSLPRSLSIGYLQNSPKLNKYRKFYQNVFQMQKEIQKNYVQNWSPLINKRQQQKQKLIYIGLAKEKQRMNMDDLKKASHQKHLYKDLKQTLIQQMQEKQKQKQQKIKQFKTEPFISKSYQGVYHPIYNPVDFKVTHDNKYILRQLKQQQYNQERMSGSGGSGGSGRARGAMDVDYNNQITGLAKNGSYVLLSK